MKASLSLLRGLGVDYHGNHFTFIFVFWRQYQTMRHILLVLAVAQPALAQLQTDPLSVLQISSQFRIEAPAITLDSIVQDAGKKKWVYTYDEKGQNTSATQYIKLYGNTFYSLTIKEEYQYDPHEIGRITKRDQYSWKGSKWELDQQTTWTYNLLGKLAQVKDSVLYFTDNRPAVYWLDYHYDYLQQLTLQKRYRRDTKYPQTILTQESHYTFDEKGREISSVTVADKVVLDIFPKTKNQTRSFYNETDTKASLVLGEYFEWDTSIVDWRETSRTKSIYEYDSEGRLTELSSSQWDSTASDWGEAMVLHIEYDANGNVINNGQVAYTYDSVLRSSVAMPYAWDYGDSYNRIVTLNLLGDDVLLYYSDRLSTDLKKEAALLNQMQVFPNPMNDYVQVINVPSGGACQLWDAMGNNYPIQMFGSTINVRSLASGVYTLQVSFAESKRTFILLKK